MTVVAQVIEAASAVGLHIKVDGDRLLLEAASEPPAEVLNALASHKGEVIAFLRSSLSRSVWNRQDWEVFFNERAGIAEFDGKVSRAAAEERAYKTCIAEWLNQNFSASAVGTCVGCGRAETVEATVVPFGVGPHVWLHPACWPSWYRGRVTAAEAALELMGITKKAQ